MSQEAMLEIILTRDQTVRPLLQLVRDRDASLAATRTELVALREPNVDDRAAWMITRRGTRTTVGISHLTNQAGMAIALRKNLGNVAASALGAVLLEVTSN